MIGSTGLEQAQINIQNSSLNTLSGKSTKNMKEEELMQAARDFESVFLNQFLGALNKTVDKDGYFSGGRGEEMFKSMLNQEIAKEISSSPQNFGFAQQIYEQMKNAI